MRKVREYGFPGFPADKGQIDVPVINSADFGRNDSRIRERDDFLGRVQVFPVACLAIDVEKEKSIGAVRHQIRFGTPVESLSVVLSGRNRIVSGPGQKFMIALFARHFVKLLQKDSFSGGSRIDACAPAFDRPDAAIGAFENVLEEIRSLVGVQDIFGGILGFLQVFRVLRDLVKLEKELADSRGTCVDAFLGDDEIALVLVSGLRADFPVFSLWRDDFACLQVLDNLENGRKIVFGCLASERKLS